MGLRPGDDRRSVASIIPRQENTEMSADAQSRHCVASRLAALTLVTCALIRPAAEAQAAAIPSLAGTWTNSSITVLERADPRLPLRLSEAQAQEVERQRGLQNAASSRPTPADEGAPAAGGAVLGYNTFWLDRGERVGRVRGEARSSWITEPSDGRIPFSAEGRRRADAIMAARSPDGPEGMNPADRCLVASRGTGGPPMLNNIYNNTYEIIQTDSFVVIHIEMNHDVRIIPLNGQPRPAELRQWLGDSIGRWEDGALIVETRNWKAAHGDYEPVFLSETALVRETFRRIGADELLYQFEIEDPVYYDQTWKGELSFFPAPGRIFEYACHEGNYALPGILRGARVAERSPARDGR
jgi:hypothetical protein